MDVRNQKFIVFGVSKSGCSVAKYILSVGGNCSVYEELKSDKIAETILELKELGAKVLDEYQVYEEIKNCDVVVVSPGVPINHELLVLAKKSNKRIVGELEFGFNQFSPLYVAVTGTNGKTTTVNMIGSILKRFYKNCELVGNVGVPVTEFLSSGDKHSVYVAEVSSFQLETVKLFCPHIACFLNFAPDHLERHYSVENYLFLKKRIFSNMSESEYAVLNYDDSNVKKASDEVKCKVVWVSLNEQVEGAYRFNGDIFFNGEYILSEKDVNVFGEHNLYNLLFAVAVCKILGVPNQMIVDGLKEFRVMKHRLELILEQDGVKYFNDSKATNTASTLTALENMKRPTVLILGGSEKGENYEILFNKVKQSFVKFTVLTGASRFNMFDQATKLGCENVILTDKFETAVKVAKSLAEDGDNVLLSPACASFDEFKSYEERGDAFKNIVEKSVD